MRLPYLRVTMNLQIVAPEARLHPRITILAWRLRALPLPQTRHDRPRQHTVELQALKSPADLPVSRLPRLVARTGAVLTYGSHFVVLATSVSPCRCLRWRRSLQSRKSSIEFLHIHIGQRFVTAEGFILAKNSLNFVPSSAAAWRYRRFWDPMTLCGSSAKKSHHGLLCRWGNAATLGQKDGGEHAGLRVTTSACGRDYLFGANSTQHRWR